MKSSLLFVMLLVAVSACWAERTSQGAFLPVRAQHEFFEDEVYVEPGELLINEIQAKNISYPDPFGDFDDWVEIYNPNNYSIDIGGMYMTDNHFSGGITAWTQIPANVPAITTIPAHGYLVVWFDEEPAEGPLHINNKLGGAADAVYLIDSDGSTIVDFKIWTDTDGLDVNGISLGRLPDGGAIWQLFGTGMAYPCTPGAANQGVVNSAPVIINIQYSPVPLTATTPLTITAQVTDDDNNLSTVQLLWGLNDYTQHTVNMALQGGVYSATIGTFALNSVIQFRIKATDDLDVYTMTDVYNLTIGYQAPALYINEIMASNTVTITDEYGEYEDWIEIYNPNDFAVNLAGFYLADNHFGVSSAEMTQISSAQPDSTTIPAGGYKIIWFDQDLDQGVLHVNTKLGVTEDTVYLVASDMLTVVDSKGWNVDTGLDADLSYGRYPDGTNNWILFGGANPHPVTPGSNNFPTSNEDETSELPKPVLSAYPNPMYSLLNISVSNAKTQVKVKIYDLKGRLVDEIVNLPGAKSAWSGTDKYGKRLGSGVYILKAETGGRTLSKKICLIH